MCKHFTANEARVLPHAPKQKPTALLQTPGSRKRRPCQITAYAPPCPNLHFLLSEPPLSEVNLDFSASHQQRDGHWLLHCICSRRWILISFTRLFVGCKFPESIESLLTDLGSQCCCCCCSSGWTYKILKKKVAFIFLTVLSVAQTIGTHHQLAGCLTSIGFLCTFLLRRSIRILLLSYRFRRLSVASKILLFAGDWIKRNKLFGSCNAHE